MGGIFAVSLHKRNKNEQKKTDRYSFNFLSRANYWAKREFWFRPKTTSKYLINAFFFSLSFLENQTGRQKKYSLYFVRRA